MNENQGSRSPQSLSLEKKVDLVLEVVVSLQGQVQEMREVMATKSFVEITVDKAVDKMKEELHAEIRPIARAVDKDAVTLVNHERRIGVLERQVA